VTRRSRPWPRGDEGVSALEAVILAPALLAMLALAIVVMRVEVARQAVESAAHDGARAASIQQSGGEAQKAAEATVKDRLVPGHLCKTLDVAVDTAGFAVRVGQPATVSVTITCVADFSDVAIPGMPGSTTITETFVSELDQFRQRSP
jgi:Flp pilus assembly protein TadG